MIGLALAALIVAYTHLVGGATITSAVCTGLYFLWNWSIFWLGLISAIAIIAGGIGGAAVTAKEAKGNKAVVATGGVLGCLLVAGIFVIATCVPTTLALSGIYIMYHAIIGHATFATVPTSNLVIGGVLYGISILMGIARRSYSASTKKG